MNNAINKRVSRRAYELTVIDNEKKELICSLIQKYNNESGLMMEWIDDGSQAFDSLSKSYGLFKNVRSLIALKGNKNDEHLLEKIGYFGELLVLEATKMDLGTCWVAGTFDKVNPIFKVDSTQELVAVITIGNVKQEKNLKEKLVSRLVGINSKSIESFIQSDTKPPEWFIEGIKAVKKAPSAINKQPVMFKFDNNRVCAYVADEPRRLLIDLGIAKAHFELATNTKLLIGNNTWTDFN